MTPRATIIDCDPGTDDAVALWLALASPELDLRLVSVVGGNVGLERTVANACAIVALSGRPVPVMAGSGRALLGGFEDAAYVHGDDGLGGVALPPGTPPQPGHAVDAMRVLLRAAAVNSVTLVGIGPATNLGLLLATEPGLADRIAEIVLMTGAWGEGNVTPSAEFNAWNDPEALAIVLACGRPITLATLDLTNQALCRPEHVARLRAAGGGRRRLRARHRRHLGQRAAITALGRCRSRAARFLRGGVAGGTASVHASAGACLGRLRRGRTRAHRGRPLGAAAGCAEREAARSRRRRRILCVANRATDPPAIAPDVAVRASHDPQKASTGIIAAAGVALLAYRLEAGQQTAGRFVPARVKRSPHRAIGF